MKIIRNKEIYIQKTDIFLLSTSNTTIPKQVTINILNKENLSEINNDNKYDFIKFTEPEIIDFFSKLDWILNYDEVKDLNEIELLNLEQDINEKMKKILKKLNSLSDEFITQKTNLLNEWELLNAKKYSINDFLAFKQGYIHFVLPKGVKYPVNMESANDISIKKLIRKIMKIK